MPENFSSSPKEINNPDESYFRDIFVNELRSEQGERLGREGFAMEFAGPCIRATSHQEALGLPSETYHSFFNGTIIPLAEGGFAVGGRLAKIVSADRKNESVQAFRKFNPQELMAMGDVDFHSLNKDLYEPIEQKPGQSIEDMRFTPVENGVIGLGVALNGMYLKREDGSTFHIQTDEWSKYEHDFPEERRIWDIGLVLAKCDPNLNQQVEAVPILGGFDEKGEFHGYKNGVFLGTGENKKSYLLCRTMDEMGKILYASTNAEDLTSDWRVEGELPGFRENFPDELKDKVVRVGPGTNPIYLKEMNAWVAGFHWVMRGPDTMAEGKTAEYYIGGLMKMESICPPKVTSIEPWGISPMDAPDNCRKGPTLFRDLTFPKQGVYDKPVVFPVGAVRTEWKGEDSLVISAGWGDAHEHLYKMPINSLVERFNRLEGKASNF